jgi:hypothetical protein
LESDAEASRSTAESQRYSAAATDVGSNRTAGSDPPPAGKRKSIIFELFDSVIIMNFGGVWWDSVNANAYGMRNQV